MDEPRADQDLVEYFLVAARVTLRATVGMKALPVSLNTALNGIGATLGSYVR